MINMVATAEAVAEADKPFYLAVTLTGSWVLSTCLAVFWLKDIELAKFLSGVFGPAAGMGYMFYLAKK